MAASNITAAFGYVIWLRAKKLEDPLSRYLAHLVCRYNPKPAVTPDHRMTIVPSNIPICDIARGMARTPAPMIVLTRLMTLLSHDAWPMTPDTSCLLRLRRRLNRNIDQQAKIVPLNIANRLTGAFSMEACLDDLALHRRKP